jgi:hypothetical protein
MTINDRFQIYSSNIAIGNASVVRHTLESTPSGRFRMGRTDGSPELVAVDGSLETTDLTVTGNVASHLIPKLPATYDLGTPEIPWRDLYLSNASLHIGEVTITASSVGGEGAAVIDILDIDKNVQALGFSGDGSGLTNVFATALGDVETLYEEEEQNRGETYALNLDPAKGVSVVVTLVTESPSHTPLPVRLPDGASDGQLKTILFPTGPVTINLLDKLTQSPVRTTTFADVLRIDAIWDATADGGLGDWIFATVRQEVPTNGQTGEVLKVDAQGALEWGALQIDAEDIVSGTIDCERLPADVAFSNIGIVGNLFVEGTIYAERLKIIDPSVPRPVCGSTGGILSTQTLVTGNLIPLDDAKSLGSSTDPWASLTLNPTDGIVAFGTLHSLEGRNGTLVASRPTSSTTDAVQEWRTNVGGNDTVRAVVKASGDFTNVNGAYGQISDARLKDTIQDARSYMADLANIRVVTYTWKDKGDSDPLLGVIAQEVHSIFPHMVEEDASGYLSVKTSVFIPMLITAVQTLRQEINDLRDQINKQ